MSTTTIEHIDGTAIARIREDMDAATVSAIQAQLDSSLGPDALSLIVDLSQTNYIDSAGIDMLLRLGERLDQRRAKLMLVIPPDSQLNRLVRLVGLDQVVAIHPTIVEAQSAATALRQSTISADGAQTPASG